MNWPAWDTGRKLLLEIFVLLNYGILSLDIYLAHSINRFRHWTEWIPLGFSIIAAAVLGTAVISNRHGPYPALGQRSGAWVGYCSIGIGVAGLLLHLESQFFSQLTIKSLVYTAPFVAPLAYCGLGFLLLLNRDRATPAAEWGPWVVFLALGGFVGNLVLSLADHAQNGFFSWTEWVPVVGSAFAVGFLTVALFERSQAFLKVCLGVLVAQALIGVVGFYLHMNAAINGVSSSAYENFIHGAPILAPLLFTNLFALAALGIADLWVASPRAKPHRNPAWKNSQTA